MFVLLFIYVSTRIVCIYRQVFVAFKFLSSGPRDSFVGAQEGVAIPLYRPRVSICGLTCAGWHYSTIADAVFIGGRNWRLLQYMCIYNFFVFIFSAHIYCNFVIVETFSRVLVTKERLNKHQFHNDYKVVKGLLSKRPRDAFQTAWT